MKPVPDDTTQVVRQGLERACRDFSQRIIQTGFTRTKKVFWTARHPLQVDFIHFHRHGISVSWLDILLPVSLASIWLGAFVWQLRGRAILPVHDPEFDEALGSIIERSAGQPGMAR